MNENILADNEEDIIMTGYVASGGISCILHYYENELREKLYTGIIEGAKKYSANIDNYRPDKSVTAAADCLADIYPAGEGGVFKALWDMAEKYGRGLVADIKSMPIRQEYIEICEYYNINPYMLYAGGVYLIMTKHGNRMLRMLRKNGIESAIIGYTTDNNDRIIVNGDEIRYIDSRIEDELKKFGGICV